MKYSNRHMPDSRKQLIKLIQEAGDIIKLGEAAVILNLNPLATAKKLSRWTEQGWLRRISRGIYVAATLDTLQNEFVLEDPWVLVPALFDLAYIGGRSASEYWDLTEQIFNDIVILTNQSIRGKSRKLHGVVFTLKYVKRDKIFGVKTVWRRRSRVQISDIHKTIIDMLDDPSLGGGIQHVAQCLYTYLKRKDRDDNKLIAYADRMGNGAIFKRLGFLVEKDNTARQLVADCKKRLTQGNCKLDPIINQNLKLITKWHLLIPENWINGVHR